MKPHSRQKSLTRETLIHNRPDYVPQIAMYMSNDNVVLDKTVQGETGQGETASHNLTSHYTISRDETSLGSSMKDKLRAAGGDEPYKQQQPYPPPPEKNMVKYVEDVDEDLRSVRIYSARGIVPSFKSSSDDVFMNPAYSVGEKIEEDAPSEIYNLVLLLQEKVKALQGNNEKPRQQKQQENKRSVNFKVFHCILNHEKDEQETYLEKPYWAATGRGFQLKANSPILYPDAYIQYNSIAFVIYRYYSRDEKTASKTFQDLHQNEIPDPIPMNETIQLVSENMKEAIEALTKNNEEIRKSIPIRVNGEMQAPYNWWWYYRDQPNLFDNLSKRQAELIQSLTNWIEVNYSEIYNRTNDQFKRGMVSEASLSFLIQPGDVLVHRNENVVEAYQATSWLSRGTSDAKIQHEGNIDIWSSRGTSDTKIQQIQQEWNIDTWSYGYNGKFYKVSQSLSVKLDAYTESTEVPIVNLSTFPLRFAPHTLRQSLEQRGKIFWSCRYNKYISYASKMKGNDYMPGQRYMIDYPTYQILHPDSRNLFPMSKERVESTFIEQEMPCEPDIYLLPRTILGFNLRRKKWDNLDVDLIEDISWNKDAFRHLVADPDTKELVQALVTNKVAAERGTDLMENKGNGLIMLLHGGPGTGKTFTAESVAEMAEKPLYPVTCGDIGTKPEDVEKYLESVFHLGKIWGCVVLLDEAEVFLEQRSLNDLERNALVSVFLRALEYYDGILILTSNRVGTFDEAFKSRIQLALHYEPLTRPQREQIWRNFFRRLKSLKEDKIDYDDVDSYITELSEQEMNGRQIRNVITTARQWAQFQNRTMAASHLKYAIKVTSKFDTYLKDVKEGFSDEQIARGDGVR